VEITLDNKFSQIRAWFDAYPEFPTVQVKTIRSFAPSATGIQSKRRTATIEMRKIVGPRALYGLLSAQCDFNDSATGITIEVAEAIPSKCMNIPWALSNGRDHVLAGIASEYTGSIIEGATLVAGTERMGGSVVSFLSGGVSEVDSCQTSFRTLAKAITQLFASEVWPPNKEDLGKAMA
jgi:hypothetical protein